MKNRINQTLCALVLTGSTLFGCATAPVSKPDVLEVHDMVMVSTTCEQAGDMMKGCNDKINDRLDREEDYRAVVRDGIKCLEAIPFPKDCVLYRSASDAMVAKLRELYEEEQ